MFNVSSIAMANTDPAPLSTLSHPSLTTQMSVAFPPNIVFLSRVEMSEK